MSPAHGWLFVKVPMDFRVHNLGPVTVTATVANSLGTDSASITATPSELRFDSGDGGGAICSAERAQDAYVPRIFGACSYTYENSSAIAANGYFDHDHGVAPQLDADGSCRAIHTRHRGEPGSPGVGSSSPRHVSRLELLNTSGSSQPDDLGPESAPVDAEAPSASRDPVALTHQLGVLVEHLRSYQASESPTPYEWLAEMETRQAQFETAFRFLELSSIIFGAGGPVHSFDVGADIRRLTNSLDELQRGEDAWRSGLFKYFPDGEEVVEPVSPRQAIALVDVGFPPEISDEWQLALTVQCPYCAAAQDEFCLTMSGWFAKEPHGGRRRAACRARL